MGGPVALIRERALWQHWHHLRALERRPNGREAAFGTSNRWGWRRLGAIAERPEFPNRALEVQYLAGNDCLSLRSQCRSACGRCRSLLDPRPDTRPSLAKFAR